MQSKITWTPIFSRQWNYILKPPIHKWFPDGPSSFSCAQQSFAYSLALFSTSSTHSLAVPFVLFRNLRSSAALWLCRYFSVDCWECFPTLLLLDVLPLCCCWNLLNLYCDCCSDMLRDKSVLVYPPCGEHHLSFGCLWNFWALDVYSSGSFGGERVHLRQLRGPLSVFVLLSLLHRACDGILLRVVYFQREVTIVR